MKSSRMKYDPTKNPEQYVIWRHENATDVMSPALNKMYGRERICTCLNQDHEKTAKKLARLLNQEEGIK